MLKIVNKNKSTLLLLCYRGKSEAYFRGPNKDIRYNIMSEILRAME